MKLNTTRTGVLCTAIMLIIVMVAYLCLGEIRESKAGIWTPMVVKLYSNGDVVGSWEAVSIGEVEGNSLVFETERKKKVRISGTYSVEPMVK